MVEKYTPTPEEVQKEFEDFVQNRFGGSVQVFTHPINGPEVDSSRGSRGRGNGSRGAYDLKFDYTPKEIKAHLDRFVIGQDEAKKALAIAVCDHYNYVTFAAKLTNDQYAKQNVLILGPTGVGKTYLIRQIARLIGVPFVKADATRFSETGYVGANVDDLIRDLVSQANGDIELAQYGIVYLDEADKLATPAGHGNRDVSGRGVQFGLLKLMEETELDLSSGNDMRSQLQAFVEYQQRGRVEKKVINTKNILFIVSGAFTALEDIVKRRLNHNDIGFNASMCRMTDEEDFARFATTQDFVDYGFEPEFIGRLPVRVACHHLSVTDLTSILKNSEGSIIRQYEQAFRAYGIDIRFSKEALDKIAEQAYIEKTGARALMTVCEKVLRDYKYELPSSEIRELVVTDAMIDHPRRELEHLLSDPVYNQRLVLQEGIRRFESEFGRRFGMRIEFNGPACELICEYALKAQTTSEQYLEQLMQSFEHGLKLVEQTSGQSEFHLGEDVVQHPDEALEKLIRESYAEAAVQTQNTQLSARERPELFN